MFVPKIKYVRTKSPARLEHGYLERQYGFSNKFVCLIEYEKAKISPTRPQ